MSIRLCTSIGVLLLLLGADSLVLADAGDTIVLRSKNQFRKLVAVAFDYRSRGSFLSSSANAVPKKGRC
ncbi:MAG: hypothetical protein GY811_03820 [Myxococcales bacterium]|nr:hypothetical protein [Myxococcales bacterium]